MDKAQFGDHSRQDEGVKSDTHAAPTFVEHVSSCQSFKKIQKCCASGCLADKAASSVKGVTSLARRWPVDKPCLPCRRCIAYVQVMA
jgi:hypothetical protein